jgi:hypothetical protein
VVGFGLTRDDAGGPFAPTSLIADFRQATLTEDEHHPSADPNYRRSGAVLVRQGNRMRLGKMQQTCDVMCRLKY